jgi:ABC-type multidrug transport system fused ATPase/permease subunit
MDKLWPYKRLLTLNFAAAMGGGLLATVDPLLIRYWLDVVLHKRAPIPSLIVASLLMGALIALSSVGRAAVNGVGTLFSFRVSQLLGQDLRAEVLEHMSSLSADWHEETLVGEKLSRIEQDVEQVAQFAADVLGTMLRSVIFFVMNFAIMFTLDWRTALAVLPLLPPFLWVRARFRRLIQLRADRTQTEVGRSSGLLAEYLGAIPQIQILGAEQASLARTLGVREEMLSAQWSQRRTEIAFTVSITAVMALAFLCVLGLGSYEHLRGALSIGGLMALYTCVLRVFDPVATVMELYSRSQRMRASASRVRKVLDTLPTVKDDGHVTVTPSPLIHGLACSSVCFAYGKGKRVLHDISFSIGAGERVALIGSSGSGKSSLARLLARMADPTSGMVTLEEMPAGDYVLSTFRKAICYVPQHAVLFSGTVRENLLYADPDASDRDLADAIETAQLRRVIERLPQGIDTVLGPEAAGLSGGERQRLAIARALLRRSAILILDESTSALDMPTERAVFRAIAEANTDQTIVIISHRLQSLTWVDRIVLLDTGRIIAQGTHTALYRDSALYLDLFESDEEAPAGFYQTTAGTKSCRSRQASRSSI